MNGSSTNCDRLGLTGPEYFGFGTKTARPVTLKLWSFQGPSTTFHTGLVAKVVRILDSEFKKFHTLTAPAGVSS